tara:strand:+ start:8439 stop:9170 length:732 start_codon:yes stop_codon:yes gene_type:complete
MKRICIIGNSHAGTIRRAFDNLPKDYLEEKNLQVTIHSILDLHEHLYLDKHYLRTSNGDVSFFLHKNTGKYNIDLSQYDCIVSYGGGLMANPQGWSQHVKDYQSGRYSRAALLQSHIDDINESHAVKLLTKIINASFNFQHEIIVLPSPVSNESHPDLKLITTDIPDYMDYIEDIYHKHFKSQLISFLSLPRQLLAQNGFSISRKYKKEVANDHLHLNDDGGKIVATLLLEHLTNMYKQERPT